MKKTLLLVLALAAIAAASAGCNLPSAVRPTSLPDAGGAVARTDTAQPTDLDLASTTPTNTPPPSDTPAPTVTPSITATFTPAVPIVSVSKNTNCRTGPGTVYDLVLSLLTGDEAEVVARSSVPNYVIIEIPGSPGSTCWLWMQYGSVSGSTDGLPVRTPPPTPTPVPSPTPALDFSLSVDDIDMCGPDETVFIKITNTGALTIESARHTGKDQDTSETVSVDSDGFTGSGTCIALAVPSISPGDSAYRSLRFTHPIAGHTINITVKACAGDGLAEPCVSKSISFEVPAPSDVQKKENFEPIDPQAILAKVAELPITTWNYSDSSRKGRHIGPMAQDFNELLGVGESQEYINAVDSYGVSLAAIQALSELNAAQAGQIEALEAQNADLAARLEALEAQGETSGYDVWHIVIGLTVAGAAFLIGRRRETS
ncbi:MAG: tail fiber domain-containing protein [Anaerolineales bacterium]